MTSDTQAAARKTERGPQAPGDLAFERREWKAERLGMVAMAVIIAAAPGGCLGGGGIWSVARSQVGVSTFSYERFVRRSAVTPLALDLHAVTDIALSFVMRSAPMMRRVIEGAPLVIVDDGVPLDDRMKHARVDVDDVLTAARDLHGLERLGQIRRAVLERSGGISIIPRQQD